MNIPTAIQLHFAPAPAAFVSPVDYSRETRMALESELLAAKAIGYGVQFDGQLVGEAYHDGVSYDDQMTLAELARRGGKVSRVRILREGRYADLSYCHGTLPNGTVVPLYATGDTMCMPVWQIKKAFIGWAQAEGVNAKALGLLDEGNWAVLRG